MIVMNQYMDAFLLHASCCDKCRPLTHKLCPDGYRLFEKGAARIERRAGAAKEMRN